MVVEEGLMWSMYHSRLCPFPVVKVYMLPSGPGLELAVELLKGGERETESRIKKGGEATELTYIRGTGGRRWSEQEDTLGVVGPPPAPICTAASRPAEMEEMVLNALMNGALLVVSVAMLATLCIRCGGPWNRTSIPQNLRDGDTNEQYQPILRFHVVRPTPTQYQSSTTNSRLPSSHLSATSPVQANRRSSFTPTNEGGSIPSYENHGSDHDDYVNNLDNPENPDNPDNYIVVLPDPGPVTSVSLSNQSILSTPSSEPPDYVNIHDSDTNSDNYINVPDRSTPGLTPGSSHESIDSDGNPTADYVNTSVFDVPASIC
ncbi:linker for activation of T-cells family member 1-like [Arapaima gigas]